MALRSRFSFLSLFLLMLPCLASALDITGVVVDEQDKPLAGVRVAAGEAGAAFNESNPIQTVTDSEGKFAAKAVPDPTDADFLVVEAFMPGRTTDSEIASLKDPKEVKIKLAKGRAITIQLLDLQGKPAAGVKVAQAECKFPSLWGLIIQTDKNGKVTFPVAPATGVYGLCVSDSRYVHSDISVRVPEDDDAKFKVVPGGSVEGKLVDHAGKPIAGASVSVMADQLGFWGGYGTAKTDAAGKFKIARLDAGDVFVSMKPKPAYAIVPIKCKVERGKVTELGVIKAPIPGAIEGQVLDDETGKPVEGIDIQYTPEIWSSGWGGDRAQSDKDGGFKILGLGTVSAVPFLWNHPIYREAASSIEFQKLTMKSGQVTTYNVRLKKASSPRSTPRFGEPPPPLKPVESLKVLVLDEQGNPVPGCKLRLFGFDSSKQAILKDELAIGETDKNGSMTVPVPKGDSFVWVASKAGYTDAWNGTTNTVSDPVVIRLFKDAPVRGQLVNEAGKAVPNARITAEEVSGYCYTGQTMRRMRVDLKEFIAKTPSTVTDSRGTFTLSGIPTKHAVSLQISHPEYLQCSQSVTLPARQVKLSAVKPTTFNGKLAVNYPSLASIPLAVKVAWYGSYSGEASAPLKADGSFEVSGVPSVKSAQASQVYARATLCLDPNRKLPEGVSVAQEPRYWPHDSVLEIRKPDGRTLCFGLDTTRVDLSGKHSIRLPVTNLVKISGVVYGRDGKPASGIEVLHQGSANVGDLGPRSWRSTRLNENGRWATYVRAGSIRIAVTENGRFVSTQDFKSSLSASLKEVVFDLSKPATEEPDGSDQYITAHIRVIDRKGVAVPRPRIKVEGSDVAGLYNAGCGLDGTVDIGGQKGSLAKITSVFLKNPAYFKLQKTDEWKVITFDYTQPDVPTPAELKDMGIGFG